VVRVQRRVNPFAVSLAPAEAATAAWNTGGLTLPVYTGGVTLPVFQATVVFLLTGYPPPPVSV